MSLIVVFKVNNKTKQKKMIKRKERNDMIDKHDCALDTTNNRRKRSSKRDQSHKIAREKYDEVRGKRKGISRKSESIAQVANNTAIAIFRKSDWLPCHSVYFNPYIDFYPCNNFFYFFFLFYLFLKRCNSKMQ